MIFSKFNMESNTREKPIMQLYCLLFFFFSSITVQLDVEVYVPANRDCVICNICNSTLCITNASTSIQSDSHEYTLYREGKNLQDKGCLCINYQDVSAETSNYGYGRYNESTTMISKWEVRPNKQKWDYQMVKRLLPKLSMDFFSDYAFFSIFLADKINEMLLHNQKEQSVELLPSSNLESQSIASFALLTTAAQLKKRNSRKEKKNCY